MTELEELRKENKLLKEQNERLRESAKESARIANATLIARQKRSVQSGILKPSIEGMYMALSTIATQLENLARYARSTADRAAQDVDAAMYLEAVNEETQTDN